MILVKKALRSIWRSKRSFAACVFLISLGIASFVGFSQAGSHLMKALDSFYLDHGFGEVFASVGEISQIRAEELARIDGVAEVTARTAVSTRYLAEGDRQLSLRVLSWEEEQALNQPLLLEGGLPRGNEIAVSKNFYDAQNLSLGDTLSITANGRQLRPVVTGVVTSPEYILEEGEGMTGDGATSGYAFMAPAEASTLADTAGYQNDLVFRLEPGYTFRDVEPDLEEALAPYGLVTLYDREDHPSHWETYVSIASLSSTALMISVVFLGVAVLVLTIIMRRVVEQERTQIGTLKAFGFGSPAILVLYLLYGVAISGLGCLLGCVGGIAIARWAAGLYLQMFLMPEISMALEGSLFLAAALISLAAGSVGAVLGARSVLRLSPAESMRPPAPPLMKGKRARAKPSILPVPLSMALRGISRGRGRSVFVAGGMAVSFAILTFMASYAALTSEYALAEFDHAQLYDMKLSLTQARLYQTAVQSAEALPHVEAAEGVLELSVTFYNGHLQEDAAATGLVEGSSLRKLYDSQLGQTMALPSQGVVLSRSLADKLEAEEGDVVQFITGYTGDRRISVPVTGLLAENSGSTAYMNLEYLCGLLGAQETVNGLLLHTANPTGVIEALDQGENVAAMVDQRDLRQVVQNMLDQTMGVNLGLFLIIGFGMAFAIIVTTASISLSERSREYATMRVLGMEPLQIGLTLVLEYLLLTGIALLPGIPLALGLRAMLMASMTMPGETMYISPFIAPRCYLMGAGLCLLTVVLANASSIRQIARLDMTETLKERE